MDDVSPAPEPSSQTQPSDLRSIYFETLALCSIIQFLVTVIGGIVNVAVIVTSVYSQRFCKIFDYLIFTLVLSDAFVCVVVVPMSLYSIHSEPSCPHDFCPTLTFLAVLGGVVSMTTVSVIALHRLTMIIWQPKRKATKISSILIISFIWCVGLVLASVTTVRVLSLWKQSYNSCAVIMNRTVSFGDDLILRYIGPVFVVCFIIVFMSYTWIGYTVSKQVRTTDEKITDTEKVDYEIKSIPVTQVALERDSNAMKMCLLLTVVLFCCWVPIFICQIVEKFSTQQSEILLQIKIASLTLIYVNSALNPILYANKNTVIKQRLSQFRYQFCVFLGCEKSRKRTFRTKVHAICENPSGETAYKTCHFETDSESVMLKTTPRSQP
ncbi:putative G-protein coupled receptor 75 [Glandiceps talaboti]